MSDNELKNIIKEIKAAPKIAFFHHVNPDGDALSCSYGLLLAIRKAFPDKTLVLVTTSEIMRTSFPYLQLDESTFVSSIDESYLGIIGDTAVLKRIEKADEFIKTSRKICFDHHKSGIDFKADVYWAEPDNIASAMQAINIVEKLGVKLDEEISFYLAIGLLSDSGNFTYSKADPKPPLMYSWLLWNISNERMENYFRAVKSRDINDIALTTYILNKLKYHAPIVYLYVKYKTVQKYGRENIKNKINIFGNINEYPIWIMLIEKTPKGAHGEIEVHFRSTGVDVSGIATQFRGGGHANAAGATLNNKKELPQLLRALSDLKPKLTS